MSCKFLAVLAAIAMLLSGCISMKSVVDPVYGKTKYEDLAKSSEPVKLRVNAEFQRNGQHLAKADTLVKDNVERVLRASNVITPSQDGAVGDITVVVNNFGDMGEAAAKGFGTGLTFGLVGSTVTDYYEMTVTIALNGKLHTQTMKHAIHTTVGNASTPPGLEVVQPQAAFERVVEQMLLNTLKEFQQTGVLASVEDSFFLRFMAAIRHLKRDA